MTKDLRTIGAEERKALRARAVGAVQNCRNISKVSRDLGINRQVLHQWLKEGFGVDILSKSKIGRAKQKIYKPQARQILEIIAHNLPSDMGIDSIFWSVSSVRKLIGKTLDINASAYLVRRWLLEWGVFTGRNAGLLEMSSAVASKGLPIRKFAEASNMSCYVFWRSCAWTKKGSYYFQCVSSKRGDIRFVGEKCESVGHPSVFLNKLQEIAKRNIVIVYDESSLIGYWGISMISKSVVLFRRNEGKLRGLSSSKSRTEKAILAFLWA